MTDEFLVSKIAKTMPGVTSTELKEALETLGFSTRMRDRKLYVSGKLEHPLLGDRKFDAAEASAILTLLSEEHGKNITEVASLIAANGGKSQTIEVYDSDEEANEAVKMAERVLLRKLAEQNRQYGKAVGFALEVDRYHAIRQGRVEAWEDPQTNAALNQLIAQDTERSLNMLMGKPGKLNPIKNILKTDIVPKIAGVTEGSDHTDYPEIPSVPDLYKTTPGLLIGSTPKGSNQ